jgi:plastocyanin
MKKLQIRRVAALLACLTAVLVLASCGGPSAPAGTTVVTIKDLRFNPQEVRIKQGETVRWVNEDTTAHTSTSADFSADATTQPPGAWNSPPLNPGDTFDHKFDQTGTFPYACSIHGYIKGTVVVEAR